MLGGSLRCGVLLLLWRSHWESSAGSTRGFITHRWRARLSICATVPRRIARRRPSSLGRRHWPLLARRVGRVGWYAMRPTLVMILVAHGAWKDSAGAPGALYVWCQGLARVHACKNHVLVCTRFPSDRVVGGSARSRRVPPHLSNECCDLRTLYARSLPCLPECRIRGRVCTAFSEEQMQL